MVWTPLEPIGKFLNSFSPFSSFLSAPLPPTRLILLYLSLSIYLSLSLSLSLPPSLPPSLSLYLSPSISLSLCLSLSLLFSLEIFTGIEFTENMTDKPNRNYSNLVSWLCLENRNAHKLIHARMLTSMLHMCGYTDTGTHILPQWPKTWMSESTCVHDPHAHTGARTHTHTHTFWNA